MKTNDKKEFVNEQDRVMVLTVYEYETPGSHMPIGYRFYAVSASGKLEDNTPRR
jgi:hypothetical protein